MLHTGVGANGFKDRAGRKLLELAIRQLVLRITHTTLHRIPAGEPYPPFW